MSQAAARKIDAGATLRDRLKDPSLLREQCYSDGAWGGRGAAAVTNPVSGVTLASAKQFAVRFTGSTEVGKILLYPGGRRRVRLQSLRCFAQTLM